MINFCQFGAGRIGAIHAGNIAGHPDARLQIVVDPDRAAAVRLACRYGAAVGSQAEALAPGHHRPRDRRRCWRSLRAATVRPATPKSAVAMMMRMVSSDDRNDLTATSQVGRRIDTLGRGG